MPEALETALRSEGDHFTLPVGIVFRGKERVPREAFRRWRAKVSRKSWFESRGKRSAKRGHDSKSAAARCRLTRPQP